MSNYILVDGVPVLEPDLLRWAQWYETTERHVADTTIGDVRISTVFLGVDHSFGGARPVLWETMIFGGEHDGYCELYTTLQDSRDGHEQAVALVRGTPAPWSPDNA